MLESKARASLWGCWEGAASEFVEVLFEFVFVFELDNASTRDWLMEGGNRCSVLAVALL